MVSSIDSIMYNLEALNERNSKVNYGLSSGEALEYGSDDSMKFDYILDVQNDLRTYNSIQDGISYNTAFSTASDSALSDIKTAFESINALVIQANTDTTSQDEKEIIATQIDDYKETLLSLANTEINGQYLFSGINTDTQSFSMDETTGVVSYDSDNSTKTLNVDKNTYVNQGVNGIDVFYYVDDTVENGDDFTFSSSNIILDASGNEWELLDVDNDGVEDGLYLDGDTSSTPISITDNGDGTFTANNNTGDELDINSSTFDLLDDIVNALNLVDSSGTTITEDEASTIINASFDKIDLAYNSINNSHSLVGTRTSNIETYSDNIQTKVTNLTILEEEYASADLTALAVEAQSLENTYTALYSTINRVNSLSLVDYLN